MPRAPQSSREVLGSILAKNRPVIAETLAAVIGRGPRQEKAESDRRLFWTPAIGLEEAQRLADSGMDPFEQSRQEWPYRWDAVDKDGRDTLKKQAAWVARMTRLGPPEDLIRRPAAPDPMTMTQPMDTANTRTLIGSPDPLSMMPGEPAEGSQ